MEKKIEEQILDLVKQDPQTISSIKRSLNLDYKNAWRYCRRMYDQKIINLIPTPEKTQRGKPVYVTLRVELTEKEYMVKILNEIKRRGKISSNEFALLLMDEPNNYMESHILRNALFKLPYFSPPLIKREISLTPEGEEFLKKHTQLKD